MLAGAGFGNNFTLAHSLGKQGLTKYIVDFMCAGMVQFVTFQIKLGTTKMCGQPLGKIERAWQANIMCLVIGHVALEGLVGPGLLIGLFNVKDQRHQGFGNKAPAMNTEPAGLIRLVEKAVNVAVTHYKTPEIVLFILPARLADATGKD